MYFFKMIVKEVSWISLRNSLQNTITYNSSEILFVFVTNIFLQAICLDKNYLNIHQLSNCYFKQNTYYKIRWFNYCSY